ncbi:MAG: hypothetical protein WBO49_05055 [Candidatus Saccharimonas sp.]
MKYQTIISRIKQINPFITLSIATLVAQTYLPVVSAVADTQPTSSSTPKTVSADPLPTVQVDGIVWKQALVGNTVYAVGTFNTARPAGVPLGGAGTVTRTNILAYDIRTGVLDTNFVHSVTSSRSSNKIVNAVVASPDGKYLYIGGQFDKVDGQTRNNFAAFNLQTNTLMSGFSGTNNRVLTLAATNSRVYVGGQFTTAAGQPRTNLAAYLSSGALDTSWRADVTGPAGSRVQALATVENKGNLIVAGAFNKIAGSTYLSSGAVKLTTGAKVKWASQSSSYPIRMQISKPASGKSLDYSIIGFTSATYDGSQVYLSGFGFLQGAKGAGVYEGRAAVSPTNGAILWINKCRGDTYDSVPIGKVLYSVGHPHNCKDVGAFPEQYVMNQPVQYVAAETTARTSKKSGSYYYSQLLHWYPKFAAGTKSGAFQAGWSIVGNSTYVAIGGEFLTVEGVPQQGLVRFAISKAAPNKVGPRAYQFANYGVWAKPANSKKESTVTVYATSDNDNQTLTYELYRKGSTTKLASKTVTANWWQSKSWTYTDKNVPKGTSLEYYLIVKDPFGNSRRFDDTALIDDSDSRVKYSGSGWKYYKNRPDTSPDFGRTIHRLSKNGSSLSMKFTGTSISMFTEMNAYSGVVDVSIDGGAATRVNLNYDNGKGYKKFQQVAFSKTGLSAGSHTIVVKKVSGSYVYIDAFKVR